MGILTLYRYLDDYENLVIECLKRFFAKKSNSTFSNRELIVYYST
jgi:hypothetical protein